MQIVICPKDCEATSVLFGLLRDQPDHPNWPLVLCAVVARAYKEGSFVLHLGSDKVKFTKEAENTLLLEGTENIPHQRPTAVLGIERKSEMIIPTEIINKLSHRFLPDDYKAAAILNDLNLDEWLAFAVALQKVFVEAYPGAAYHIQKAASIICARIQTAHTEVAAEMRRCLRRDYVYQLPVAAQATPLPAPSTQPKPALPMFYLQH